MIPCSHTGSGGIAFTKAAQIARDKLSVKNNRLARALLLMLEHEGTNRKKTGAPKWTGKISIEHILPRNISKPGADWDRHWTAEKQSEWLHRLGNLAMLNDSDNSSLGNCGFQAKIGKIKMFRILHLGQSEIFCAIMSTVNGMKSAFTIGTHVCWQFSSAGGGLKLFPTQVRE